MAKTKTDKVSESPKADLIEIIDEKAIVNIRISTSFYQRLQHVYLSLIKDKKPEDIQKFLENVKSQSINTEEDYNIETMLIIISEFQKVAKTEGFTKHVTQEELQKITEEFDKNLKQ
jgi:lipoate-protein ligase A